MTPVLYYAAASPPCRCILLLAKMLELELDQRTVNPLTGEQMKPEFIKLNPQHCLPTIDDGGLVLWESRAIMAYLVSAYGKDDALYPNDVRVRALVDQRLQFDLGTLYLRMTEYFFPTIWMGAPLDETKKAKLHEALGWLDTVMKGRTYSAADHFTIADLSLLVTVSQCEAFGIELIAYKNVRQWLQRCREHMEPYDYADINVEKEDVLVSLFLAKCQK